MSELGSACQRVVGLVDDREVAPIVGDCERDVGERRVDEPRVAGLVELVAAKGNIPSRVAAVLTTPQGYKLTAITSVLAVERILSQIEPKIGFATPSMALGQDFIMEVDQVTRELV